MLYHSILRKVFVDPWNTLQGRFTKPVLNYLELHLTDHCNLNCRGCGHFSPIADKWFASLDEHDRDMHRLSELLSTIRQIRLMGGEPLLHPEVASFLKSTRAWFPSADIRIVTNGLLLPKMPELFWGACATARIGIDVTVYPPFLRLAPKWRGIGRAKGVPMFMEYTELFYRFGNFSGDSNPESSFRSCRSKFYCPFLRQGKLYVCGGPALCQYPNKYFGTHIPSTYSIDLYEEGITGRKILAELDRPVNTCSYCCEHPSQFKWGVSNKSQEEWDAKA
jgi:hypothetical protein